MLTLLTKIFAKSYYFLKITVFLVFLILPLTRYFIICEMINVNIGEGVIASKKDES